MNLLLFGADGQVGFELRRSLTPLGNVTACTHADVDLADAGSIVECINRMKPDWIVNAAAYTAVDLAEDQAERARAINADALDVIGRTARSIGARVLHYSTDYVFDGAEATARDESAPCAPIGVYGQTKLDGERALADSGAAHLILRTAWVYAARGRNFLKTMLRLGAEREVLRVVADQHGTPTSARLIAESSALMVFSLRSAAVDDTRFGTYHLTAAGQTTWHGFADALIASAHELGLLARRPEVQAISTDDYPTRARRPQCSVLDTHKLERTFGLHMPDWRLPMAQVLAELKDRQNP
ncbi:MAG: dTDP-4-dehydrorhamnose reductase [Ahniella sp.]|nr:dTDP-4-dehydrorhamnose reductase [Ahniella sp.]